MRTGLGFACAPELNKVPIPVPGIDAQAGYRSLAPAADACLESPHPAEERPAGAPGHSATARPGPLETSARTPRHRFCARLAPGSAKLKFSEVFQLHSPVSQGLRSRRPQGQRHSTLRANDREPAGGLAAGGHDPTQVCAKERRHDRVGAYADFSRHTARRRGAKGKSRFGMGGAGGGVQP